MIPDWKLFIRAIIVVESVAYPEYLPMATVEMGLEIIILSVLLSISVDNLYLNTAFVFLNISFLSALGRTAFFER